MRDIARTFFSIAWLAVIITVAFGQSVEDPRVAALRALHERLDFTIDKYDSRLGQGGGVRKTLDERLSTAGVGEAGRSSVSHWAGQLAWTWTLNETSVMKYAERHSKALAQTVASAERGGVLDDAIVARLTSDVERLEARLARIETIYSDCVFTRMITAGRHLEDYEGKLDAYYEADGEQADALRAAAYASYEQYRAALDSAWECERAQIEPLLAADLFGPASLQPGRGKLQLKAALSGGSDLEAGVRWLVVPLNEDGGENTDVAWPSYNESSVTLELDPGRYLVRASHQPQNALLGVSTEARVAVESARTTSHRALFAAGYLRVRSDTNPPDTKQFYVKVPGDQVNRGVGQHFYVLDEGTYVIEAYRKRADKPPESWRQPVTIAPGATTVATVRF